jgi:hypothetical protein
VKKIWRNSSKDVGMRKISSEWFIDTTKAMAVEGLEVKSLFFVLEDSLCSPWLTGRRL